MTDTTMTTAHAAPGDDTKRDFLKLVAGATVAVGVGAISWPLIDSMNRAFDQPLVERTTGGTGGGGAALTLFGADVLERYRRLEKEAAKLGSADLKMLDRHALPEAGPKV